MPDRMFSRQPVKVRIVAVHDNRDGLRQAARSLFGWQGALAISLRRIRFGQSG
jgi:hypothetical protein